MRRRCDALHIQSDVVYALLDLELHGALGEKSKSELSATGSTALLHALRRDHSALPPSEPAGWPHASLGHLASYGACYYSYLWARSLSRRVWRRCFAAAPDAGDAGRAWCSRVLAHGGAREPRAMLREMLASAADHARPEEEEEEDPILGLVPVEEAWQTQEEAQAGSPSSGR